VRKVEIPKDFQGRFCRLSTAFACRFFTFSSFSPFFLRIESPAHLERCALCTSRSRMPTQPVWISDLSCHGHRQLRSQNHRACLVRSSAISQNLFSRFDSAMNHHRRTKIDSIQPLSSCRRLSSARARFRSWKSARPVYVTDTIATGFLVSAEANSSCPHVDRARRVFVLATGRLLANAGSQSGSVSFGTISMFRRRRSRKRAQ